MNDPVDSLSEATARFCHLLNQQDKPFRDRVTQRSKRLEDGITGIPGECGALFNEVLRGNSCVLKLVTGSLPTVTNSSAITKETAAILCRVSLGQGLVKGRETGGSQHLGWDNLNKDAKGWCKNLLLAQGPTTGTLDEFRDLLTAKLFAAILVDYLLPCTPRAVARDPADREVILERPVDD